MPAPDLIEKTSTPPQSDLLAPVLTDDVRLLMFAENNHNSPELKDAFIAQFESFRKHGGTHIFLEGDAPLQGGLDQYLKAYVVAQKTHALDFSQPAEQDDPVTAALRSRRDVLGIPDGLLKTAEAAAATGLKPVLVDLEIKNPKAVEYYNSPLYNGGGVGSATPAELQTGEFMFDLERLKADKAMAERAADTLLNNPGSKGMLLVGSYHTDYQYDMDEIAAKKLGKDAVKLGRLQMSNQPTGVTFPTPEKPRLEIGDKFKIWSDTHDFVLDLRYPLEQEAGKALLKVAQFCSSYTGPNFPATDAMRWKKQTTDLAQELTSIDPSKGEKPSPELIARVKALKGEFEAVKTSTPAHDTIINLLAFAEVYVDAAASTEVHTFEGNLDTFTSQISDCEWALEWLGDDEFLARTSASSKPSAPRLPGARQASLPPSPISKEAKALGDISRLIDKICQYPSADKDLCARLKKASEGSREAFERKDYQAAFDNLVLCVGIANRAGTGNEEISNLKKAFLELANNAASLLEDKTVRMPRNLRAAKLAEHAQEREASLENVKSYLDAVTALIEAAKKEEEEAKTNSTASNLSPAQLEQIQSLARQINGTAAASISAISYGALTPVLLPQQNISTGDVART